MDKQKVDLFIISNSKYFTPTQLMEVRNVLNQTDDEKWILLQTMQYKDPVVSIILSVFFGQIGVDRFLIGDIGLGVGKLLTCGGFGVWWLVDLFLIMDATKQKNFEQFMLLSTMR